MLGFLAVLIACSAPWGWAVPRVNAAASAGCQPLVTSTADSGAGSLRSVVACAAADAKITFSAATFLFPRTITLTTGEIPVDKKLHIQGPGQGLLTITTAGASRIFHASAALRITGMTLREGRTSASGGAVFASASTDEPVDVTMSDVAILASSADRGGALYATGAVTIEDSLIMSNSAAGDYGGFYAEGSLALSNSLVTSNSAGGLAGGFTVLGPALITNSVIAANQARDSYGGFYVGDTASLINTQVLTNSTDRDYGGFYIGSYATISGSLIAANSAQMSFGGFYVTYELSMTNSQVMFNTAGKSVGGFRGYYEIDIANSVIASNAAISEGIGGFLADGDLSILNSQVLSNTSGGASGGFLTIGELSMVDSQILSNRAGTDYGGFQTTISSHIENSTIAANTAGRNGGGIGNSSTDEHKLEIINSTIADNVAEFGGGLHLEYPPKLVNTSIVSNSAPVAAGIFISRTRYTAAIAIALPFFNSIIGGAIADQCASATGPFVSLSQNNISNDPACDLRTVPSIGVGPLGNHGGNQLTAPLVAGSPALDAADNARCKPLDQRGEPRIGQCDIGAYESRGFRISVQSGASQIGRAGSPLPSPLVAQFFSDHGEPVGPGGMLIVSGPIDGATISPSIVIGSVGPDGRAVISLVAGTEPGTYPITITAPGITTPTVGNMMNVSLVFVPGAWR
jgi:hypothetical protein